VYKLLDYFAGDNGITTCELCGTRHIHQYIIEDTNTGKIIEVGSQCAKKILGIKDIEKQGEQLRIKKEIEESQKLRIEESEKYISISGKFKEVEKAADQISKDRNIILNEVKRMVCPNSVLLVKYEFWQA
jgi:hypothetical protein